MADPRHVAMQLLGSIKWETEMAGFCRCPGERLHTKRTGKKDCRVCVDGAPTVHCFHASCQPVVSEANRRLRRALGGSDWALRLPTGQVIRSGDILQSNNQVLPREVIAARAKAEGRKPDEHLFIESLKIAAERFKAELFEFFHWPMERIIDDSPCYVAGREAEGQFQTWCRIWPAHCHIWIGDIYSSGKPDHRGHFRPIAEWYKEGPGRFNFTCGSSFKPGSYSRSNDNLNGHRFLVIESDTLPRDEVGAIFAYLNRRLRFSLHAIVDTAGKSLHGWFDAPKHKTLEERLKAELVTFGCDPKVFTYSQPVRVPGALRDGKLQRLIWLRAEK